MSDSTKFINTYIDVITGTLHEQLGSVLQLKTQLKLLNDLLIERDSTIVSLSKEKDDVVNQLNQEKTNLSAQLEAEKNAALEAARNQCEAEKNAIRNELSASGTQDAETIRALQTKVSHMDTLLKQLSDTQKEVQAKNTELINKDATIAELEQRLAEAKNPAPISKSLLSASTSKPQLNNKVKSTKTKGPDDDF